MVNYFTYIKQTLCEKYQKIYLHKFTLCDFSLYTTNTYVQMDTLNSHTPDERKNTFVSSRHCLPK